jgi:NAD(P)-dependent dehydrogenase (short-subunit alcohol dehydrogenase family)
VRVFVAGATGVLGRQLVPILAANGHRVIGMGRRRTTMETSPDVELVTADALEPAAVNAAVKQAAPDAVINLLTAIPARLNTRRMAQQFQLTNAPRERGISWRPPTRTGCDAFWRKAWRMPMIPATQHEPTKMCRFGSIRLNSLPP